MNRLWEQFVYVALRQKMPGRVKEQVSRSFWKPENGRGVGMRPDIVIDDGENHCQVLDAKWKNLDGVNPSPEDLRQLFVYREYFNAKSVALLYPGEADTVLGQYAERSAEVRVIAVPCVADMRVWKEVIGRRVRG